MRDRDWLVLCTWCMGIGLLIGYGVAISFCHYH